MGGRIDFKLGENFLGMGQSGYTGQSFNVTGTHTYTGNRKNSRKCRRRRICPLRTNTMF